MYSTTQQCLFDIHVYKNMWIIHSCERKQQQTLYNKLYSLKLCWNELWIRPINKKNYTLFLVFVNFEYVKKQNFTLLDVLKNPTLHMLETFVNCCNNSRGEKQYL